MCYYCQVEYNEGFSVGFRISMNKNSYTLNDETIVELIKKSISKYRVPHIKDIRYSFVGKFKDGKFYGWGDCMEESTYHAFDIKELKEELESQKKELEFHQRTIDDIEVELGKRRSEIREEYQKRLNNLVSDIVEDGFEIKFVQTEYDTCPNNIRYNLFVDYNDDKSIII